MNFEEIINKYSNLTYKIAINMTSSPEESQDIVQESYISLYYHYKKYKKLSENEIKNILCKIVLNKCKDYLKSRRKKEYTIIDDISNYQEFEAKNDFIDKLIQKEENTYIKNKLDSLKEPYNKVLNLYYLEELSLDEIAKKLGTSKGTIKVQITRGKHIFNEILRKERIS